MPIINKQFRISRTLPNGWRVRLDILPTGNSLNNPSNTIAEEDAVSLLELGSQKNEFDSVPYGLSKPQTLKIKLGWSRLSADLQSAITDQPSDFLSRNIFLLYSDRGTNGATYSLEFAGCEDNIEAFELEPLGENEYAYSIELADLAYMAMKTANQWLRPPSSDDLTGLTDGGKFENVPNNTPWQIYLTATRGRNQAGELSGLGLYMVNTQNAMSEVSRKMALRMRSATRSESGIFANKNIPALFDRTNTLRNMFTAALELYGCTTDGVEVSGKLRRKNTPALGATALYLVGKVVKVASNIDIKTLGGIFSGSDNYGWDRNDNSAYDVLRDLCETLGVKASYRFEIVPGGTYADTPYDTVGVIWDIKRIASSRDFANNLDTPDDAIAITKSITDPKITVRGDNILKSEVRYETSRQEDKTEIVRISQGARASRSMNVEPIVHNIPIFYPEYDERRGRYGPFQQTNHIFFKGNGAGGSPDGSVMKVHEDTLYWYGPGATQYVSVTSTASDNPWDQTDDTQQATAIQLAAMQSETSMAAALTKLHLKAFSDENNALVEIEWPLTVSPYVLPSGLAGRHQLTGGPASVFTYLAWSRALPVSIDVDWVAGTSKMKYYLLKPTTAN